MYQELHTSGSIVSNGENIKWEGHSDGNTGTMKIMKNINGNKTSEVLNFTRDELEELLNQTVNQMPLDKRLIYDFMSDEITESKKSIKSIKSKSKSKSNRNKSTKAKKSRKKKN